MIKKAIVIVSFGTTMPTTREKTIDRVVNMVKNEYPGYDVFQAYTSRIVIQRVLENEGKRYYTEDELLHQLAEQGFEEVYIQPLHIIPGAEYHKIISLKKQWEKQRVFCKIEVGRPLLHFIGQEGERPDDYAQLIRAIAPAFPTSKGEVCLLVGHGTLHPAQSVYSAMQLKLMMLDVQAYLATMEGFPECEVMMNLLQEKGVQKVFLRPFFFVAGDHVTNDIFGEEDDSVMNQLKAKGFEVVVDHEVFGEMDAVCRLYLAHLDDAIHQRYTKRPSHRPPIPTLS